jgi:uncharacterized protein YndB with AHSA1/START domain
VAAKNSIDLETDPRSIIGTRVLRRRADPKHLAQWWGPNGFTTTTYSFEFRPVTFEDLGKGQTCLTWHGKFPSAEERARVIREYGADKG